MPENQSTPPSVETAPDADERRGDLPESGLPPEPRSFGSDDMEGLRTGPDDQNRRFRDYGGQTENESDRLPSRVSQTPAAQD